MSVITDDLRLVVGTRGSELALAQTQLIIRALQESVPGISFTIKTIATSGDRKSTSDSRDGRDKKDWVSEIEQELVSGAIDFAVHSAKDVPVEIDPLTLITPITARANPLDAFILAPHICAEMRQTDAAGPGLNNGSFRFLQLPKGARVATSSLRRSAQLLRLRPDLELVPLRGNVGTRVATVEEGALCDAIVLACAGLERIGLGKKVHGTFARNELLPAVNQGVLVGQYRRERLDVAALLAGIVHDDTLLAFEAERAFVTTLGADCNSAVAVLGSVRSADFTLTGRVLSHDGREVIEETISCTKPPSRSVGVELAELLVLKGASSLL